MSYTCVIMIKSHLLKIVVMGFPLNVKNDRYLKPKRSKKCYFHLEKNKTTILDHKPFNQQKKFIEYAFSVDIITQ